jgi:hypothetical protein
VTGVPVNTSVGAPVQTVEGVTNVSNVSPYQTYTPVPTSKNPLGSNPFNLLFLAVLVIAGGAGIALLSRYYRGRQEEPEEDVSATPDGGANQKAGEGTAVAGFVSAGGHTTLDQIADYDPATTEVDHLMQILNKMVKHSQKSLNNSSIRLDTMVRLSGIPTLPIPERVAQWGADHGYVVVSRDFKNEALLFRQIHVPGEPDLGIMYVGDIMADNEIPSKPEDPNILRDRLDEWEGAR